MKSHPDGIDLAGGPRITAVPLKDGTEEPVGCHGLLRVRGGGRGPHRDWARLAVGVAERLRAAGTSAVRCPVEREGAA